MTNDPRTQPDGTNSDEDVTTQASGDRRPAAEETERGPRPDGGGDAGGQGTGRPESDAAAESTTSDLQDAAHRAGRSTQS
jgi:hypothetical protein